MPDESIPRQQLRHWQFTYRHIILATTGIAAVFGLAVRGGWVQSDAVVYLSFVIVAAVFSSTARRVLLGWIVILGACWLAFSVGDVLFGQHGRGGDPRSFWILAGILTICAGMLRLYTKAGALSLTASLLVAELFLAIVIVYTYGHPMLFEALLRRDYRVAVLQHLGMHFPIVQQWMIVLPWLMGIALGDVVARVKVGKRSR